MRAILFAAVSTGAQAGADRYSLQQQIEAEREVCAARGWPVITEIVIEGHSRNYSWLDEIMADCPGYAELIRAVRARLADLIVVRDYDRLWRTDALRAQVMAVCREHRVQVFSLNQPVEAVDPLLLGQAADSHMILEALSGVISESENRTRTRRMMAGKSARVTERGLPNYSNAIPFGYRRDEAGAIVVDLPAAEIVRWIFEQRAGERWGYNRIARALTDRAVPPPGANLTVPCPSRSGHWHDGTVRGILRNPFYIGHIVWGVVRATEGQHEAIISEALWHRVRQVDQLRQMVRERSAIRGHRLLTGLARCGFCGHAMVYVPAHDGGLGLRCTHYLKAHGRSCRTNWMRAEPIEEALLRMVADVLRDPDAHLAMLREERANGDHATEIARLEQGLQDLDARWARWAQAYESGAIGLDEMLQHRQRLHGDRSRLTERLEALAASDRAIEATAATLRELAAQHLDLASLQIPELRGIYTRLIARLDLRQHENMVVVWL